MTSDANDQRQTFVFLLLAIVLMVFAYSSLSDSINELLCQIALSLCAAIGHIGGVPIYVDRSDMTVAMAGHAVKVVGLCSGLRGVVIWIAAVFTMPGSLIARVLLLSGGIATLCFVNAIRIVHLLHLEATGSPFFTLVHELLWPTVLLAVILGLRYFFTYFFARNQRYLGVIHV